MQFQYLGIMKKVNYKKVFKEAITADMLESIIDVVHYHTSRAASKSEVDQAAVIRVLEGCAQSPKIEFSLSMLPALQVQELKEIFQRLSENDEKVLKLKSKYSVV